MPTDSTPVAWSKAAGALVLGLLLASCAVPEQPAPGALTWAGRTIGTPPAPKPDVKRAIISRATREWEYFGRQTVVMKGSKESIPNVGAWEDDDSRYSGRVNAYWRAVDKPRIYGMDCQQPWSAAFMSWVVKGAGVPEGQFHPAPAHWIYLSSMIEEAPYPGRYFVPRRVSDYSPNPGDLICAFRGPTRPSSGGADISAGRLEGAPTHCDLVVSKSGNSLEAIGGNVRNSVSKVTLELDNNGRLKRVPRRPWFLILENRL
jgi:hypothetical protein